VAHPTRANVVIFRGVWWFDTDSGQWIETPQTINLPTGVASANLHAPRLSSTGRWLTVFHQGAQPGAYRTVVFDLDNPRNPRAFDSIGIGVVGLDGDTLVHRRRGDPLGLFTLIALESGVQRAQVQAPSSTYDLVAAADGTVYFPSVTTFPSGAYLNRIDRLRVGQTVLERYTEQPGLPAELRFIPLQVRGTTVLASGHNDEGCSLTLSCTPGQHELLAFSADGVLLGRSSTVQDAVSTTWYSTAANGVALQGLPEPVSVGTLNTPTWRLMLALGVLALALRCRVRAS
jgi:hypothetical protein